MGCHAQNMNEGRKDKMKKEIFAKNAKKIFAFALAAALAAPTALTVNVSGTAAADVVESPEKLKTYDFESDLDSLISEGEAEIVNSETIYVVKAPADLAEGEKLDANGLVYTGEGADAKYVTVAAIGSPKIIDDAERGKVLQFDPTMEEIDRYNKTASAKTEAMDETTAKMLDFQLPVNDYYHVESGTGIGTPLTDQSVSVELKVKNPFGGLKDELKEYEETDDVGATKYGSVYSPTWTKGLTVSYWIKVPVDENGAYKNSSVLRWENDNTYYFQADDYAKYLPTKLFDQQYAKMTDENKDAAKKASPSGVYRYGLSEDGRTYLDPDGLMDFYFEYAKGYSKKDENGYVVADNLYTDSTGMTGPVYNKALIDEMQAAYKGKTSFTGTARFYFANPNFVDGFFPAADGSFTSTPKSSVTAVYDAYHTTPTLINASGESVQPESSYIKLRTPDDKIDPGQSMVRYALVDSELQIDADDSFFFILDDNQGINENKNVKASYGTQAGMQNGDVFFMNSWQESATKDKLGNGLYASAVYAAVSPVTKKGENGNNIKNGNAGEWHHVTITLQNDWAEFYVDGECVNVYDTYSSRGKTTLETKESFKRFNKGAGTRYGFGAEKVMGNIMYGNYVCRLMMDWLGDEDTMLCIGGIGNYAEKYAQATTTSEVCLDNIQFYNAVLTEDQIMEVYKNGDIGGIKGILGDVDGNGRVDLNDATLVLKVAVGIDIGDVEFNEALANMDSNENIDLNDATLVLKAAVGIK